MLWKRTDAQTLKKFLKYCVQFAMSEKEIILWLEILF